MNVINAVLKRCAAASLVLVAGACGSSVGRPSVLVAGDSITLLAAPAIRARLAPRYNVTVRGIIKADAATILKHVRQRPRPDILIMNAGTLDVLNQNGHWRDSFDRMIRRVATISCVEFVTLGPTLDFYANYRKLRFTTLAHDWNVALRAAAASHSNFHIVDWGNALLAPGAKDRLTTVWLGVSGIHPSPTGDEWLATHFREAIDRDC